MEKKVIAPKQKRGTEEGKMDAMGQKREMEEGNGKAPAQIRAMTEADYDQVYRLWKTIRGFGIRSMDDSREGIARFIRRNPTTSMVAEKEGEIVGAILCGHDGRRGCFYHVCVREDYRQRGIGKEMAVCAMRALQEEHINKVCLIAFKKNEVGNSFWKSVGWTFREDLNYYDFVLNDANITTFQ